MDDEGGRGAVRKRRDKGVVGRGGNEEEGEHGRGVMEWKDEEEEG